MDIVVVGVTNHDQVLSGKRLELLLDGEAADIAQAGPIERIAILANHRACTVDEQQQHRGTSQDCAPVQGFPAHRPKTPQRLQEQQHDDARGGCSVVRIRPHHQVASSGDQNERDPRQPHAAIANGEPYRWKRQQYAPPGIRREKADRLQP